jgi:transposase
MREWARLKQAEEQLAQLEKTLPQQVPEAARERIAQLIQMKAVGPVRAQCLLLELFWRQFNNRREVGACVGLVPQPYDSGESRVNQGISKAGNRRVRALPSTLTKTDPLPLKKLDPLVRSHVYAIDFSKTCAGLNDQCTEKGVGVEI